MRCIIFKYNGKELKQESFKKFKSKLGFKLFNLFYIRRKKAIIAENH